MLIDSRISALYNQQQKNTTTSSKPTSGGSTSFQSLLDGAISAPSSSVVDLDSIFERAASTYGVPLNLLKAVAKAESGFNPNAVSSCGAQGVMQLMPKTAASLGVTNSFDPEQNITGGAKYLSQMLNAFDGDTALALAAYNAGSGNVKKYGGVPPFKETQNYIRKVLNYANEESPMIAGYAVAQPLQEQDMDEVFSQNDYEFLLQWIESQLSNSLQSLF